MTMRILIFCTALLSGAHAPAAGEVGDRGLVLRTSELHAAPAFDSPVLLQLDSGSTVEVRGRQGLWLLARAAGGAGDTRGWLRLTNVRLSGAAAEPSDSGGGIGGGFAAFSRSVSSLLGGLRGRETRTANATIGIRGLTPGELATARLDRAALAAVAAAAASAADAERFAREGGLSARSVPELTAAAERVR